MPTAEAPENKKGGTPTDYVFRVAEGRQPRSIERALLVLRGGGTWVGLRSRAEGVPTAGGICVGFQRRLSVVNDSSLLQSLRAKPYKANVGATVGLARLASRRAISDMFD